MRNNSVPFGHFAPEEPKWLTGRIDHSRSRQFAEQSVFLMTKRSAIDQSGVGCVQLRPFGAERIGHGDPFGQRPPSWRETVTAAECRSFSPADINRHTCTTDKRKTISVGFTSFPPCQRAAIKLGSNTARDGLRPLQFVFSTGKCCWTLWAFKLGQKVNQTESLS